jgi:hypothetical protein
VTFVATAIPAQLLAPQLAQYLAHSVLNRAYSVS